MTKCDDPSHSKPHARVISVSSPGFRASAGPSAQGLIGFNPELTRAGVSSEVQLGKDPLSSRVVVGKMPFLEG